MMLSHQLEDYSSSDLRRSRAQVQVVAYRYVIALGSQWLCPDLTYLAKNVLSVFHQPKAFNRYSDLKPAFPRN